MKKLEDFLKDINTDEQLKATFENIDSIDELCNEVRKYGYDFTEDDLTELYLDAVAGGSLVDVRDTTVQINMDTHGSGNVQINLGDASSQGQCASKSEVDKMAVLKMLFGKA